jgi:hypothetical protein
MEFDRVTVGERLFVGKSKPEIFGRGATTVKGTADIEGPAIIGDENKFNNPNPTDLASLMVAETKNPDMRPVPFYSLLVTTYARIKSFLKVDTLLSVKFIKSKVIITEKLYAGTKNFKIDHPLYPENKDLIYSCLEGPEIGVYIRGRLTNKTEIILPNYWKKLVDENSISVQLQPIGSHQNIIVKRWDTGKIYLQSQGNMPIDCFYYVCAERKDVPKLEVEVNK